MRTHENAVILMVSPEHYDVSYVINPWMQPQRWACDPSGMHQQALAAARQLHEILVRIGCTVEMAQGIEGLPDMVFPANAAVVLDGRAMLARFRYSQRRGEEAHFDAIFRHLIERGLLQELAYLPEGCYQEGAGDCIWDVTRGHFWGGFGQRSSFEAIAALSAYFHQEVVPLELATAQSYHLDVCFCPLSGGEILYYPAALSRDAQHLLRERVAKDDLIEAAEEDLQHFNVNAVNIGQHIVMSRTTSRLSSILVERGYRVSEIDLSPFIMSGGGAFCMTLRLDRSSMTAAVPLQKILNHIIE